MVKKIMVVDDEHNLLELVRDILEGEGFDVITVSSGEECLEKLKTARPDLILMDIMMPGMSGKEAVKKIRANPKTKNLRIAFLTVSVSSAFERKTMKELNVLDYILKPFDNEELIRRIKKLL